MPLAPALGFGPHGVEVHEPGLEERARQRLQGLVHAAVGLDLVIQGAEDAGDGALLGEVEQESQTWVYPQFKLSKAAPTFINLSTCNRYIVP